jgi:hypothetical protein
MITPTACGLLGLSPTSGFTLTLVRPMPFLTNASRVMPSP